MPKGVLGIEAVDPFVSSKPDEVPATEAQSFPHPRQLAIAIVPQWDGPKLNEQGQFERFPIRVNSQMDMGEWTQAGFVRGPGKNREWNDPDVCRPEMLAKYPQLEASLLYLLGVLQQEAAEAEII